MTSLRRNHSHLRRAWLALGLALLAWTGLAASPARPGTTKAPPFQRPERGFVYLHDEDPQVPWSIHILKIRRGHPGLELQSTVGRGSMFGKATVSEHARGIPADAGVPLAAINGDFFENSGRYGGRPRDLQVLRGELVSAPSGHACFWLDADGTPHTTNLVSRFRVIWPDGSATPIGLNEERFPDSAVLYTSITGNNCRNDGGTDLVLERGTNSAWLPLAPGVIYSARVREVRPGGVTPLSRDTLVLSLGPSLDAPSLHQIQPGALVSVSTETLPNLAGVRTAIGGGPTLVRRGRAVESLNHQFTRHPRSAVGWNKESIFLVEVDGRQGDLSVGMTFAELAGYLARLGCTDAMNLDGGGSATMWVYGTIMNSPSEGRERPAPNALVLVEKKPGAGTPMASSRP